MKMEITVPEVMKLINEIRQEPDNLFEVIRTNVKESVGQCLSELMETELMSFLIGYKQRENAFSEIDSLITRIKTEDIRNLNSCRLFA